LGYSPASRREKEVSSSLGVAGGVGSILTQLAHQLTGLTVISTSSRPETKEWCPELGANFVADHTKPFAPKLKAIDLPEVNYIAALTASDKHFPHLVQVLAPQGKIGMIVDPPHVDVKPLKDKAVCFHWELMFTRPKYQTPDILAQHDLLSSIATIVDEGGIRTTLGEQMDTTNATNLKTAHAALESGRTKGKIVLTGF
jgi:NADPH2:quinone reductase